MSRQSFTAADLAGFPPAAHTAVASTASRTNLWAQTIWTPIPALDMVPGKAYILRCGGVVGTTGTPTIQFTTSIGTSATPASNLSLGQTTTLTLATITARNWYAEFTFGVRSIGIAAAGATVNGGGFVTIDNGAGVTSVVGTMGNTVPTTVDNTIANAVVIDVLWSASSASNTITCAWTFLQSLN